MTTQPEALRLADRLQCNVSRGIHWDAAAELRRLHAVNEGMTHIHFWSSLHGAYVYATVPVEVAFRLAGLA
jgi:hypothetical protein